MKRGILSLAVAAAAILMVSLLVGGHKSAAGTATTITIGLRANAIVYDPHSDRLYASVSHANGPPYADTVVAIDPNTGTVGQATPVGLEPNKLALSPDGHYLYVGVDGDAA